MKTDCVWVTTVMAGGANSRALHILDSDGDLPAERIMRKAKKPRPEDLPIVLYPSSSDDDIQDLPDFFVDTGHMMLSEAIAAPLRAFDLGRTYMVPAKIVLSDRKTEKHADRRYVVMNRYTVVDAFVPELSTNFRLISSPHARTDNWRIVQALNDGDIALRIKGVDLPPIWGGGNLRGVKFFRGDVVEALKAAGVAHHFQFKRCRIVE